MHGQKITMLRSYTKSMFRGIGISLSVEDFIQLTSELRQKMQKAKRKSTGLSVAGSFG